MRVVVRNPLAVALCEQALVRLVALSGDVVEGAAERSRVAVVAGLARRCLALFGETEGTILAWHRERVCPFDLRRAMVVAKG